MDTCVRRYDESELPNSLFIPRHFFYRRHSCERRSPEPWIPAFAGMTKVNYLTLCLSLVAPCLSLVTLCLSSSLFYCRHSCERRSPEPWIPAFAGMTKSELFFHSAQFTKPAIQADITSIAA